MMTKIQFEHVTKTFARARGQMLLRNRMKFWLRGHHRERFVALRDVSFHLSEGESLAIVGANGAGKTTILGLVAGLAEPDSGTVTARGRVGALLELGSGFHPDLTGTENLRLNAALLGLSRTRVDQLTDKILEFAGIGEFIDQPLRTFSAGMNLRLAFSVAIHTEPEILLIDEVLAVGDQQFQAKCLDKIQELRAKGISLICVSHDNKIVSSFCDKAIWLDHGQIMMHGKAEDVISAYAGKRALTVTPTR